MQDLRWRALAEIRKQPGCSDVQGIAINRISDPHTENSWSLCVLSRAPVMPIQRRVRLPLTTGLLVGHGAIIPFGRPIGLLA